MSATIDVPRGLDKLDPTEQALFEAMRADDGRAEPGLPDAPGATETPPPDGGSSDSEGPWIDLDSSEYADVAPASREPSDYQRRVEAAEARARAAERTRETDAAVFQARLDMLARIAETSAPAAAAAEAPIPDLNVDPIAHFREVSERTRRQVEELSGIVRSQHENQQRAQQVGELRHWVSGHEATFEKSQPAYRAAAQYVVDGRHAELEAIGVKNEAERLAIIANDMVAIALKARQDGVNPAERFYNVALGRGFSKGARPAPAPAPADPGARTNSPTPAARGAPLRLTAETIANMSDAQFETIYGRLKTNPAALRQLMGH